MNQTSRENNLLSFASQTLGSTCNSPVSFIHRPGSRTPGGSRTESRLCARAYFELEKEGRSERKPDVSPLVTTGVLSVLLSELRSLVTSSTPMLDLTYPQVSVVSEALRVSSAIEPK